MARITGRNIYNKYAPGKVENSFYKEEVPYERSDYSYSENEPSESFFYYYDEAEDRLKVNQKILTD